MSDVKIQTLDRIRMYYIDDLRISMEKIKDVADKCLTKIEREGVSGYYSGNSDIHRYVSNAWRASWALCELKRFEDQIGDAIDDSVQRALEREKLDKKKKRKKK